MTYNVLSGTLSFYTTLSRAPRCFIEIWYAKQAPSLNLNPEVDFSLHGRHLEKSI